MDVFIVVGFIYAVVAIVFAAIPFVKHRRRIRHEVLNDERSDAIKFSTFRVGLNGGNDAIVSEYGTVSSTPTSADHVIQGKAAMEDGNAGQDDS